MIAGPGRPDVPESGIPRADRSSRLVSLLSRAGYGALLALYPRRLRRRFGRSMRKDAERLLGEAWQRRGLAGVVGGWTRILRDAMQSLPRTRREARAARRDGAESNLAARPASGALGGGGPGRGGRSGSGGSGGIMARWSDDVRWTIRGLRRSVGFTAVVIGVLGLGFAGAITTLIVVDAYLLRGLPYPDSERLVALTPGSAVPWEESDPAVVEHALTWDLDAFTLLGGDGPELVRGAWISPGYAEAFGLRLALGRLFRPGEYGTGAAPVAILSHALWQRRYSADPDVLGTTVSVYASDIPDQAESFTVVGVLAEDYWHHNAYSELLVPLRDPNPMYMARLRPGIPLSDAQRALTAVALRSGAELPPEGVQLMRFDERYTAPVRAPLIALLTAVGFVLLLTCVNTAVLTLIRAASRAPEFAVRRAFGAGPARLARQVVTEGLLLSGAAALLGLGLATLASDVLAEPLRARLQLGIPGGPESLVPGARVYLSAAGLALVCGLAFGGASALGIGRKPSGRTSLLGAGAEAGRNATEAKGPRRVRAVLVGAEVALSFALLVAAGLAVRSAQNLAATDLGFEPRHRISAQINLRAARYPGAADRAGFYDRLASQARALPGVEAAGLISRVPFGWNFGSRPIASRGAEPAPPEQAPRATGLAAGPGLLGAMGVPLVRGRDLAARDRPGSPPVAVVSEQLAARLWPGDDPIGRGFREMVEGSDSGSWLTVVGVARDVRQQFEDDAPDYYVPYAQVAPTSMTVVLQIAPGAGSPIPALEEAVRQLDPEAAVAAVLGLEEATLAMLAPTRFLAAVLAGFSAYALALAVLGLYGVVAYAAAGRRRDIAVRMALGAEASQVVRMFLRESALVMTFGMVAGVAGAAILARAMASQLTGVTPWDPLTYVAVGALLGVAVLAAAWLPARRAAAADPVAALHG